MSHFPGGEDKVLDIENLDSHFQRDSNARRIKFLCLDVSMRFIVLGASTGSLYFYDRLVLDLLAVVLLSGKSALSSVSPLTVEDVCGIPSTHITKVRLSGKTEDELIAVSSKGGSVFVLVHGVELKGGAHGGVGEPARAVLNLTVHEEKGGEVTAICWGRGGDLICTGDSIGQVILTDVRESLRLETNQQQSVGSLPGSLGSSSRLARGGLGGSSSALRWTLEALQEVTGRSSTRPAVHEAVSSVLCVFDTSVVQLDWRENLVIASSMRNAVLIDTEEKDVTPVGKSAREGAFGGCFVDNGSGFDVYAARPGNRLWHVNAMTGAVMSTLNFRSSLASLPTSFPRAEPVALSINPPSFNFSLLTAASFGRMSSDRRGVVEQFLISYGECVFFVLFPSAIRIVEWHVDLPKVHSLTAVDGRLYVLHGSNYSVSVVVPVDVDRCLLNLLTEIPFRNAAQVGASCVSLTVRHSTTDLGLLKQIAVLVYGNDQIQQAENSEQILSAEDDERISTSLGLPLNVVASFRRLFEEARAPAFVEQQQPMYKEDASGLDDASGPGPGPSVNAAEGEGGPAVSFALVDIVVPATRSDGPPPLTSSGDHIRPLEPVKKRSEPEREPEHEQGQDVQVVEQIVASELVHEVVPNPGSELLPIGRSERPVPLEVAPLRSGGIVTETEAQVPVQSIRRKKKSRMPAIQPPQPKKSSASAQNSSTPPVIIAAESTKIKPAAASSLSSSLSASAPLLSQPLSQMSERLQRLAKPTGLLPDRKKSDASVSSAPSAAPQPHARPAVLDEVPVAVSEVPPRPSDDLLRTRGVDVSVPIGERRRDEDVGIGSIPTPIFSNHTPIQEAELSVRLSRVISKAEDERDKPQHDGIESDRGGSEPYVAPKPSAAASIPISATVSVPFELIGGSPAAAGADGGNAVEKKERSPSTSDAIIEATGDVIEKESPSSEQRNHKEGTRSGEVAAASAPQFRSAVWSPGMSPVEHLKRTTDARDSSQLGSRAEPVDHEESEEPSVLLLTDRHPRAGTLSHSSPFPPAAGGAVESARIVFEPPRIPSCSLRSLCSRYESVKEWPIRPSKIRLPEGLLTARLLDYVKVLKRSDVRVVVDIASLCDEWSSGLEVEFDDGKSTTTTATVPTVVVELLTVCFEFRRPRWRAQDALAFVRRFYHLLDIPCVLRFCNEWNFRSVVDFLLCCYFSPSNMIESAKESRALLDGLVSSKQFGTLLSKCEQVVDGRSEVNLPNFLLWLPLLMENLPQQTIVFCSRHFPCIQPWNVAVVCHGNEHDACGEFLCQYMQNVIHSHVEARLDRSVISLWFESLLLHGQPEHDRLFSDSRDSLPLCAQKNAHLVIWKHEDLLHRIIENEEYFPYDPIHLQLSCSKIGFVWGFIHLSLCLNVLRKAIDVVLLCDDEISLDKILRRAGVGFDWKQFLVRMEEVQRKDECDDRKISPQLVLDRMLQNVGVLTTLELLRAVPSFSDRLNPIVYPSLIQRSRVELDQRSATLDILKRIDEHLWAKKVSVLTPQVQALKECEARGKLGRLPYVRVQSTKADGEEHELAFSHTQPIRRFYEEYSGHWGSQNDFGTEKCAVCTLSLQEPVGQNIIVFPCQHAFHFQCVPEEACVCCLQQNCRNLRDSLGQHYSS